MSPAQLARAWAVWCPACDAMPGERCDVPNVYPVRYLDETVHSQRWSNAGAVTPWLCPEDRNGEG